LAIDCPFRYTKTAGSGDEVTVIGSMAEDEIPSKSSEVVIKNVSASLSGSEFFDEAAAEYTSAELRIRYRFEVFEAGTQRVTLDGEIALSLERVGLKKP
jgi:hypothetical protein